MSQAIQNENDRVARLDASVDPSKAGGLIACALDPSFSRMRNGHWEPPPLEEVANLFPHTAYATSSGVAAWERCTEGIRVALDRVEAIKLLPAEVARDAGFTERFQREAKLLARLNHPGIVKIYDFGRTAEGHFFFAMEYVDRTDLRKILATGGLACNKALILMLEICEALCAAHAEGVVHGDLTPANILLTREGHAKLADFGLAHYIDPNSRHPLTNVDVVVGTPGYMAPEQIHGQVDRRTDVFALGVLLHEMLTGRRPPRTLKPLSRDVQVDAVLDGVLLKALHRDPQERFQK